MAEAGPHAAVVHVRWGIHARGPGGLCDPHPADEGSLTLEVRGRDLADCKANLEALLAGVKSDAASRRDEA